MHDLALMHDIRVYCVGQALNPRVGLVRWFPFREWMSTSHHMGPDCAMRDLHLIWPQGGIHKWYEIRMSWNDPGFHF